MPLLVHLIDQPLPICINFQFYVHLHNLITTSNGKYEREHYSRGHGRRLMFKLLCVWIPAPGGRWIFHHMDLFFYRLFVKTGDDSFRKSGINQINTLNKEKGARIQTQSFRRQRMDHRAWVTPLTWLCILVFCKMFFLIKSR